MNDSLSATLTESTSPHRADQWSVRAVLVIAACGIGNILGATTIINATFSNFLVPVSTSLGWPRSRFSFVLTLISLVGVVAYPVAGRLIDRFGARPVALVGNLLFGLAVASLALMPSDRFLVYLLFCGAPYCSRAWSPRGSRPGAGWSSDSAVASRSAPAAP